MITAAAGPLAALAISFGAAASAAPVSPQFDSFGNLTTIAGGTVDFGGSGIPTDPAAVTDFTVGDDTVRIGIIATPRFSSPPLTNDGAGTYTQLTGESGPGLSLWNLSFYAESTGNIAAANLKLYYDLDPAVGNDLSTLGVFDLSLAPGMVIQRSENLGFGFFASGGLPGQTTPSFGGSFDPFATGEYSFRLGVDDGEFVAINVSIVPLPAAGWMLLAGVGGLVALRRRKKAS